MIHPQGVHTQKAMELFEKLNLGEEQNRLIESYLAGEEEESALKQIPFMDLSGTASETVRGFSGLFLQLSGKGRRQELKKLFTALFCVGQATVSSFFPTQLFQNHPEDVFAIDVAKAASIYAESLGYASYGVYAHGIRTLARIVGSRPEPLKEAMSFQRGQYDNGLLVLDAAYFYLKYPDVKPEDEAARPEHPGLPSGITKLFGKDGVRGRSALDEEDSAIMKQYVEIILESMSTLFSSKMTADDLSRVQKAITNDGITESDRKLIGAYKANDYLVRLLCGCSFVNFALSKCLQNTVSVCLAASRNVALEAIEHVDVRNDLAVRGGNFDEIFGIETKHYIQWAALRNHKNILRVQYAQNRELYVSCYEEADFSEAESMLLVIKEQDKAMYGSLRKSGKLIQREKVMNAIIGQISLAPVMEEVKKYLRGEAPVNVLQVNEGALAAQYTYGGSREQEILESYRKVYGRDDFSRRFEVYMVYRRMGYFFKAEIMDHGEKREERVTQLFDDFRAEELDLTHQLFALSLTNDCLYSDQAQGELLGLAQEVFYNVLKEQRTEMTEAFKNADAYGRFFALRVMDREPQAYKEDILSYSQDSSKKVKEELVRILTKQTGWEDDIRLLLQSKKAAEREIAIRVLASWNGPAHQEALRIAMETEKNQKVRTLLNSVLPGEDSEAGTGELTKEELVKELHKGGKKRSLAWACTAPFEAVHKTSGEEAKEDYLQAVLLCYASMGIPGVNPDAALLAKDLNPGELAVYVNEVFDRWLEAGAEAKKRWVLYAASIHGGQDIVKKLQQKISEWPQNARSAIAAEAVQALALNPSPQALLIVDSIARKFKFKQVKAAAAKALDFAAAQLGLSREELADRIVPDLGFDEHMERLFDYGERRFTVTITPSLEIEVRDGNGKKLKSMPAPGKRDDAGKAAAAYEEFKQMKKQMKTTVASQKMRLEQALSAKREWTTEAWNNLFVKNPVMHQFAIGLIWGIYEDGNLIQSFRYMEDGSFNTEDEDEVELPEDSRIGLIHPIELSEESRASWQEQLEDYEVIQPIEQLKREIYYRKKEEETAKTLDRFKGFILNDLSLIGKLQNMGWYHGSVQDAGCFDTFYREDPDLGLGVELHFSGSYIGGSNEDVTVEEARFYKVGTIKRGSYVYDRADEKKSLPLGEIPDRYFSEIVMQLTKAVASSKEREEA